VYNVTKQLKTTDNVNVQVPIPINHSTFLEIGLIVKLEIKRGV